MIIIKIIILIIIYDIQMYLFLASLDVDEVVEDLALEVVARLASVLLSLLPAKP